MKALPKDDNLIVSLTFKFAISTIAYVEQLETERKYVLARQLLKSGTSIGANVYEAQNAESKSDFIHKMKIAAKEADESSYWLELCKQAPGYPDPGILQEKLNTIMKILNRIVATSKRNG